MKDLIIATGNKGKFQEFEYLFNTYGKNFAENLIFAPDIAKLIAMPGGRQVEETGKTYAENAMLKARAWAEKSGLPCLADDSGLEVEALDGRPGIFSARVAEGQEVKWILSELKNIEKLEDRRAKFAASLALCVPDEFILITEGFCNGVIIKEARGSGGFGYDPVFVPDGYEKTFAELDSKIKNSISHRTNAFLKLIQKVKG